MLRLRKGVKILPLSRGGWEGFGSYEFTGVKKARVCGL
jgi:hypothetical protein